MLSSASYVIAIEIPPFPCRLSLLPLLTNTLPGPSASEVTTSRCYTNLFNNVILLSSHRPTRRDKTVSSGGRCELGICSLVFLLFARGYLFSLKLAKIAIHHCNRWRKLFSRSPTLCHAVQRTRLHQPYTHTFSRPYRHSPPRRMDRPGRNLAVRTRGLRRPTRAVRWSLPSQGRF